MTREKFFLGLPFLLLDLFGLVVSLIWTEKSVGEKLGPLFLLLDLCGVLVQSVRIPCSISADSLFNQCDFHV